jgi:hypothetical protein
MNQAVEDVLVDQSVEEDNVPDDVIISGLEEGKIGFTSNVETSYVVDKAALIKYVAKYYRGSMQEALKDFDCYREALESHLDLDEVRFDEICSLLRSVTNQEL